MGIVEDITEITDIKSGTFNPLHHVVDRTKVKALSVDMAEHGWQGAPIVAESENAWTGVHRIAAAAKLWNEDGIDVEIPRVEITDLCDLYGIDWNALVMDEHDGDTYQAAIELKTLLPGEVVDYLGFDVDGI